jgi:polysaccharide biosynthesis/export protein
MDFQMKMQRLAPGRILLARFARLTLSAACLFAVSACAKDSFLSQSGPGRSDVITGAQFRVQSTGPGSELRYALIPLNATTVARLGADDVAANFPASPVRQKPADGLIGIGDQISITIFESGSGGLFLPREGGTRAGNFVTIPTEQVGKDGTIQVPYAGTLRVAGTTPHAVATEIQNRLVNRALEPQAVVSVVDRRAGPVSVLGDVSASTRFAMDPGGVRVLEAIARAGGPRFPAYDSMVTLQRGGATYKALLSEIAMRSSQNVELQSQDVIYISHEPRYFIAMGAIGQQGGLSAQSLRFPFDDSHLMLSDAMGKAGGLLDERANAAGMFIYRTEPRAQLAALGIGHADTLPEMVPTVYLLNVRDPAGYFYASKFAVHNEDVIFASNAPATDLTKILNLLVPLTGSSANARSTGR